jgi:ubiquinone/menaquinone biosynthesis C-methylase UbiE
MYDAIYERKLRNTSLNRIDQAAISSTFIKQFDCTSFLTKTAVFRYKQLLIRHLPRPLNADAALIEFGCGFGKLGRWLARELNVAFIGIDFSSVAIRNGRKVARQDSNGCKAVFKIRRFSRTGVASGSVSAVFSLDGIYLTRDRHEMLDEIYRILAPAGVLLFTAFTAVSTDRVEDGRRRWFADLEARGFSIIHYKNVTAGWRRHMRSKHMRRWDQRHLIVSEMGSLGRAELAVSASMLGLNGRKPFVESVSRFEILASKR